MQLTQQVRITPTLAQQVVLEALSEKCRLSYLSPIPLTGMFVTRIQTTLKYLSTQYYVSKYIMKTEIKILKLLIEKNESFTIREISTGIAADYKITHTAVKRLAKKSLLKEQSIGRSIVITFSKEKFSKEIFEAENERREELLKDKNLKVLLDTLKENTKTVNLIVLVFGSYAKKAQTKQSDIDLMIIVPDEKYGKTIDKAIALLPLPVHHLIFTEEQFRSMRDAKEGNVVQEAIKRNVILYGIEQYYELIRTD